MEIKAMSIEQIEAHLEERKRVKPRATMDSVNRIIYNELDENIARKLIHRIVNELDWTPPKQDWGR